MFKLFSYRSLWASEAVATSCVERLLEALPAATARTKNDIQNDPKWSKHKPTWHAGDMHNQLHPESSWVMIHRMHYKQHNETSRSDEKWRKVMKRVYRLSNLTLNFVWEWHGLTGVEYNKATLSLDIPQSNRASGTRLADAPTKGKPLGLHVGNRTKTQQKRNQSPTVENQVPVVVKWL